MLPPNITKLLCQLEAVRSLGRPRECKRQPLWFWKRLLDRDFRWSSWNHFLRGFIYLLLHNCNSCQLLMMLMAWVSKLDAFGLWVAFRGSVLGGATYCWHPTGRVSPPARMFKPLWDRHVAGSAVDAILSPVVAATSIFAGGILIFQQFGLHWSRGLSPWLAILCWHTHPLQFRSNQKG